MSHRLQVLIPEELDSRLTHAAARQRMSKGEFVRTALESALAQQLSTADPVERLAQINAPTGPIEALLEEIESPHG
jgi:hypothetical protein